MYSNEFTMSNAEPIRILYIEDDIVTAARVQMQLDQYGYVVDLAMNGIDGLAKLENQPYDIVAVDYHLPGMNGLQVLQNLAKNQFTIPSIMLTGAGNERVAVEAMKLGVGDYLVKDTESHYLELLPAVIESELEKQQLITEKQRIKEALHERDTILEAVSFAAERFLTCANWDEPIQEVLARLGQAVTASRVYLFENHHDKEGLLLTSQRYEWVANGTTSQINNPLLHNFPYYPALKQWGDMMAQGLCINALTQNLSGYEAELMQSQNILSFVLIPVFVGKEWWGFMGYDDCLKEREWPSVVIETFKTAASLLGAAIQHEQMNKALRESEARLVKTQGIAHLGHCEWNIITNIRRLSEESCLILGLPLNNCLVPNEVFTNAIHPEDRKAVKKAVGKTISANKPYDIEFRIIRPNGEIRYVHNLSELIRDQNGKPIRFIGTLQDLTIRKQAEARLRETTQTLSAILNAATDSIVMAELDTTCVMINPAGAARLDRTVDDVLGQRLCELLDQDVANRRKTVVDQVIRTKQPIQFEDEEKESIWFEHSIYPVLDEQGLVTRIAVLSRDISQHKQTEESLKKERDFINAIINAAGSLIIVLDRAANIVRFNRTCEELTGYRYEEIKDRPLWDFFISKENFEPCEAYFNKLLSTTHLPLRHENEWITKYQTRHLIDWSHAVLLNEQNEVEYVIGTGIDITQRKQAEETLARTLAEQKVILDNSLVGIAFLAQGRRFLRVNRKLEEICGYTEEELKGLTTEILYFSKEDYQKVGSETYPLIGKGATYEGEHLMRSKDGTPFWCRLLVKAVDRHDLSQGYIWNLEDVTEQRQAEESQRLAATVFETTTEGIIVTNAQNQILMVNPAFTTITGYTLEEVTGETPDILKSGYHDAVFYEEMWQSLLKSGKWQGEIWNRRKKGEIYVQWISIVAIRDSRQQIVQYVAVFSDITKRKQTEEFIWHQAHYDALTNLPNRTLFADRLEQALQTASRQEDRLAVIFIDLDRFKWVNDTLGHKAGDLLLQEAAQRLTGCVRESDTVARLGGDEFTVILLQIEDFLQVKAIAERLLNNLSQPFQIDNQEISIGGSIGIAFFPEDGQDVETLLKNADIAMYQAKQGGRNAYQFFTRQMNTQVTKQLQLENALRRALANQEFILHYQPIIELSSQKMIGIEALLRWQPPIGHQQFPEQFMPLAENTALIIPIGEWYFTAAVQQLQKWYHADLTDCYLSINVSARQLQSSHLFDIIVQVLKETGLPPDVLVFEISEDILFENLPQAAATLCKLDDLGVQIAIDNFGSGWASLQSLRQLPIDIVKIDPFFIHHIKTDDYDMMLTEAIIKLSHKLNIKVVAEGVETQEQLAFLEEHHCDLVQGSYFSNPLKAESLFTN